MGQERTSIPTWKETHRALREEKPEDMNWPEFMALVAQDFQDGDTASTIREKSNSPEFNAEEVVRPLKGRIDDLEAELTNQHEQMGGR